MKAFEFVEGSLPKGFRSEGTAYLYNQQDHRLLQSKSGWHSFYVIRRDKKLVLAAVHFCVNGEVAASPLRAPFGSIEFSDRLPVEQLYNFITFVEKGLRAKKVRKIIIKNAPAIYAPVAHHILTVLFFNHHFTISHAELDACVHVNEEEFKSTLEAWETRRLNQALKAKLAFKKLPMKMFSEAYHFILSCREERGQSLSMDFHSLQKTIKALPDSFFLFGVYNNSELVAASISIQVNSQILYNFYSAHSKSADSLSPVVFMFEGMYNWCQQAHVSLLDLGTSAWGGKPNFSLIDFKRRVGGVPSMKLTFEKELA